MKTKYICYVGLNDQKTECQEITTIDAFKIVSNFAVEFCGYGTISECVGVYTYKNGNIGSENTLKCEFIDIDLEKVKRFCAAVKVALNQESIGFEIVQTNFDFI